MGYIYILLLLLVGYIYILLLLVWYIYIHIIIISVVIGRVIRIVCYMYGVGWGGNLCKVDGENGMWPGTRVVHVGAGGGSADRDG